MKTIPNMKMSVTSDTTDSSSSSSPVPSSHKISADDMKIGRAAANASLELHRTRVNNIRFHLEEMKKFEELRMQYKDWPYLSSLKSIYESHQLFPAAAAAAAAAAYQHFQTAGRLKGELDDLRGPPIGPFGTHPLQLPPQSTSSAESIDLTRPSHTLRLSAAGRPPPIQLPPPIPDSYTRPMHQMHYPTYQQSYYADLCYPPPPPPNLCYPPPYQPQPTQMQTPSGQLVPTAPPNSQQHMVDPYSPYYTTGYGPTGAQCYSTRGIQTPFIDATPYPLSQCPCPMQSIPKNVHTGLLIGSKTGKSPGQTNNLFAPHLESSPTTMTSTPSPISGGSIPSSTILTSIRPEKIKTECEASMHELDAANRYHLYRKFDLGNGGNGAGATDTYCFSGQPNYSLNPKLLEQPEMSVSPARGSTGLPGLPPVQAGATQPRADLGSPYGECKSPYSPYGEFKSPHSPRGLNDRLPLDNSSGGMSRGETMTSTPITSSTGVRRARVGKSMAREIVMQSHSIKADPSTAGDNPTIRIKDCDDEYIPVEQIPHFLAKQSNANVETETTLITDIKEENVKTECEDDVVLISEKLSPINRDEGKSLKRHSDTEHSLDDDLIIDLDGPSIEHSIMATKRRKILEFHKNPNKKSPPNSYKSLIKPSDPKSYLCKAERQEENGRLSVRSSGPDKMNYRRLHLNNDQSKVSANNSMAEDDDDDDDNDDDDEHERNNHSDSGDVVCIDDSDSVDDTKTKSNDVIDVTMTDISTIVNSADDSTKSDGEEMNEFNDGKTTVLKANANPWPSIADEFPQALTLEKENFMSSLELTIDQVAKGYFSDNEILSHKQQRLKSKLKLSEGRSRSESKKGTMTANASAVKSSCPPTSSTPTAKANSKRSTSSAKSKERAAPKHTTKQSKTETLPVVERENDKKSASKKIASTTVTASTTATESTMPETPTTSKKTVAKNAVAAPKSKVGKNAKEKMDERKLDELLVNESISNNNNNILIANNNKVHSNGVATTANTITDAMDTAPIVSRSSTPAGAKGATSKKPKSRGCKFSNKKRHRTRHVTEIEEIILPRRSSAVPRWSNGWQWLGEPFQGKVFLNSDDHQVVRTRYPAMVHDCGDIVRPGDCVLLRAGSKKNELGYVAKVASLWENPEDGEMMMSLLWYYRPEHTEQGRQPNDCPDEVFASKHQDHNSVACIEDKCYVLTFNEYCRYRKTIRAIEEGIDEVPSIVPMLKQSTGREVPVNTNSELILFCRRVYEFRLKRLIKNPS